MYPQSQPWHLVQLRSEMHSSLICALQAKRPDPHVYLNHPKHLTISGQNGCSTATNLASNKIRVCSNNLTPYQSSWSSDIVSEPDNTHPTEGPWAINKWTRPYVPSARRWPAWGPATSA
jgi:hypothetical protein